MKTRLVRIIVLILSLIFACSIGACGTQPEPERSGEEYIVRFVAENTIKGKVKGAVRQTILDGETCSTVTAVPNVGYKFSHWSDGSTDVSINYRPDKNETLTAYFEIEALSMPILQIDTDGAPILTKENYVPTKVTLSNTETEYEFTQKTGKIKLRGNSTLGMPKRPYKLKFDEKVDLFGNGSAKTWTLLANYIDRSLVRNHITYAIGGVFDNISETTTTSQFVEVYLNNEYIGVYQICEQVEVGKNRVDISEDIVNPENAGYLIEMDARAEEEGTEGREWFTCGWKYTVKSPDTEDEAYTTAHTTYIKSYVQSCLSALNGTSYQAVAELMDMNSFAESYIVNEIVKSNDVGFSSFYMYKKENGKLYSGPLWDYDLAIGNCRYNDRCTNPEYLYAKSDNTWYNSLLKFEEFQLLVRQKLNQKKTQITNAISSTIASLYGYEAEFNRNFNKWQVLGKDEGYVDGNGFSFIPDALEEIGTWREHVVWIDNWLDQSIANLLIAYPQVN